MSGRDRFFTILMLMIFLNYGFWSVVAAVEFLFRLGR